MKKKFFPPVAILAVFITALFNPINSFSHDICPHHHQAGVCTVSPRTGQILSFDHAPTVYAPTVTRGPYLQSGTPSSIIIKWRTTDSTDSKVWYGDSPTNLTQTVLLNSSDTIHEVTISGLTANTTYYYAVGDSGGQMEGADNEHYFKTAPVAGTSQPIRAWILGDCGTGNANQQAVRDAYYNYVGTDHTDMILLLGDNAYGYGTDLEYETAIFDMYPAKLKNSLLWASPGNHDYGEHSGLDAAYYEIFSFPKNGEAGGLASNTEKYYSFDYGNIHIISLDSHDENRNPGSPMLTWLENDLAATSQEWVVVIFHHPPYSKGSHDSDSSSEGRMIDMRENVMPICEAYGVDLVLSGHSHSYERSKLINGHYGFSTSYDPLIHDIDGGDGRLDGTGAYQQNAGEEGTVYIVTGTAGKTSSMNGTHPIMYYSVERLGSTILEVDGDQMNVKFLNNSGVVEDYLTLVQNGAPSVGWTNPSNGEFFTDLNPISLNVTASDSDGNVTQVEFFVDGVSIGTDASTPYSLNWAPAAFGSYDLKATATDNDGNTNSSEISITIQNGTSFNVSSQINSGGDDVEERNSDGVLSFTSSDLELISDGTKAQTVGLRFNNINIPSNATVTSAYIQFTVDESDSGTTNLTIKGEDHDNAPPFVSNPYNVSGRTMTTTSVNWSPVPWTSVGAAGPDQQTPDLSAIVQEIISRQGWLPDNSMVFAVTGSGERTAESYNGSPTSAATLHISYSIGTNSCDPFADDDNDGSCSNVDCDDNDATVYPGATEICDGIDNNCDGQTDEGVLNTYYEDADNDGFGDLGSTAQACTAPSGFVADNTDCNDDDANINPNATEICDGVDNNCNGQTDEGLANTYYADDDNDGFGDAGVSIQACSVPAGYVLNNSDCNDADPNINPNATETCDGVDNNCNGQTDEGLASTYYADDDNDGFGDPGVYTHACSMPAGYVLDNNDCDDADPNINPNATEICDGVDNNCNGQTDEGGLNTFYADADNDGFGDTGNTIQACSAPSGYVSDNTDCDDTDAAIYVGASCDDGDPGTNNDIYNGNCICTGTSNVSITVQINNGDDDAEERVNGGSVNLSSSDLEMVTDGSNVQTIGLRFNDIDIPPGAVITGAYIQFTADETHSETTSLTVRGEDIDDSPNFTTANSNVTSRVTTAASANWNPPAWTNVGAAGPDQQTPDLSAIVQEIVDRPGWTENNSMSFIITGTGKRTADSHNGSSANAPVLHVTFSTGPISCDPFVDEDNDGFCSDIDCDDNDPSAYPGATEICDGTDNNCNGQTDEGLLNTYYADTDNDSFGDADNSSQACSAPAGYVADNTDCDDTDADIFIGATCDDGDPNTDNDVYDLNCICKGTPVGCASETIDDWDFEPGWGIWNDGGSDSQRNSADSPYASSGVYCVRLRDNSNTSVMTTDVLDLSSYDELTVDFSYYVSSFDNANEDFWLQISTNGGSSYTTVEEWNLGDEFNNDEFKSDQVVTSGTFTANTVLRFRCDASDNNDLVYIDDVVITGCLATGNLISNINHFVAAAAEIEMVKTVADIIKKNTLRLFPNPVENHLNVHYQSVKGQIAFVEMLDQTGKIVQSKTLQTEKGLNEFQMDLSRLPPGVYFFRVRESGIQLVEKVMVMKQF